MDWEFFGTLFKLSENPHIVIFGMQHAEKYIIQKEVEALAGLEDAVPQVNLSLS